MKGLTLSLLPEPLAFAFCILNLNFLSKFGIFPIHIFEFPAKKLDSIGVVVVGGGGGEHGDNRGKILHLPFAFAFCILHFEFKFPAKIWIA